MAVDPRQALPRKWPQRVNKVKTGGRRAAIGALGERKSGALSKSSSASVRPSPARGLSTKSVEKDHQQPWATVVRSWEGP